MKLITLIILLYALVIIPQDKDEIEYIRNEFYKAVEDDDVNDALEEYLINNYSDDYNKYTPVILAYFAGVEALKAKHSFNPFNKVSYLFSSLEKLENAVKQKPNSLEIRFLRFSILHHLPGILGYSVEREQDKNKICELLQEKNYSEINDDIQEGIINFMLESERLSESQTAMLQKLAVSLAKK